MTDDFIVQLIAGLQAVNHLALLVVAHARNHGHSLVEVSVEVGIGRFNLLDAKSFQCFHELLVDEFHALAEYGRIVSLLTVLDGTFHVVDDGQNGADGLLAAVQDELGLLFQRALAVVVELGSLV